MWDPTGVTFASSIAVGSEPLGIFINIENTVYVADQTNRRIPVWAKGDSNSMTTILGSPSESWSLFVTNTGDVYVDNGVSKRVDKWVANSASSVPMMTVTAPCAGLFVDINHNLYCSVSNGHKVVKMSLNGSATTPINVAGTGSLGTTANMLNDPRGIFVDINLDLYVADYTNKRIQLFKYGQSNGITVAGKGVATHTDPIGPTGVVLGAADYLFIVDNDKHRIVEAGPNGIRCLVGCLNTAGPALTQLHYPYTVAFDSYSNMFVTDQNNNRIQKFFLMTNSCGECD
jgi:hypothetical protein